MTSLDRIPDASSIRLRIQSLSEVAATGRKTLPRDFEVCSEVGVGGSGDATH